MLIGVPKEIKPDEYRVALTPAGAEMLKKAGHDLIIETSAGIGSGFTDDFYENAGAEIVDTSDEVWARAEMIMKVKEPIRPEWPKIREGQVVFTYFHFAADRELTDAFLDTKAISIAYETVELPSGELPLLTPMSEVAGRMAIQEGAKYLEKPQGGLGVLLGGVPGVLPGKVLILGPQSIQQPGSHTGGHRFPEHDRRIVDGLWRFCHRPRRHYAGADYHGAADRRDLYRQRQRYGRLRLDA